MQWTPWQSLLRDHETTEEIQQFLSSRRKFPRLDAARGGRKELGAYLERQRPNATGATNRDESVNEAIVLAVGRPSLLIRDGKFEEPDLSVWRTRLAPVRAGIESVIPSVGRIEVLRHPDFEWLGTAWVIDDRTLVTNRHVAREFSEFRDGRFMFRRTVFGQEIGARVDFLEEFGEPDAQELDIQDILFVAPNGASHPDMALLRVGCSDHLPAPIGLADRDPVDEQLVGVIGYPARDSRNDASDMSRIFRDIFDVKRFAPGLVMPNMSGHTFQHDCTTLGGNSGSPVIDLASGRAVGLHFGGRFAVANFAVKASTIQQILARNRQQIALRGREDSAEERTPEDYEDRQGYREDFLGQDAATHVPMPELTSSVRGDAVRVSNCRGVAAYSLDYTHFSVVMSRSRRLALFTAVNIDGQQEVAVRRRRTPWKIDPRIPRDLQAGNELYRHNPLDRGHLVRRLDPVWGTDEEARRANDDSFHYTNAAPQHERLNQRSWLSLEDYLLDNANARDLKISVFTGPIYSESDPHYRGFQIPQDFWKVAVMVSPSGTLHATAYMLSQRRFLDDLEFVFGRYRTYQVPVTKVEEETGLRFGELSQFDPLGQTESMGIRSIDGPEDLIL